MKADFEYRKLKGRIVEVYGSYGQFAEALGISNVTMSKKLTGKTQFSQTDIIVWCEALSIPLSESALYFFA